MYIDDDPDARFIQNRLLRGWDGEFATVHPDETPEESDLILLDFYLENKTALDHLPRLIQQQPNARVAILSNVEPEGPEAERVGRIGLTLHAKPISVETLELLLHEAPRLSDLLGRRDSCA